MRRILCGLLAAATAAAAGCNATTTTAEGTGPPVRASAQQPFRLAVGQSATLDDERLTLRFEAVTEDSRCPVDVTCVWAGEALLAVHLARDGKEADVVLGRHQKPWAEFDGLRIEPRDVEPAPHSGRRIPQAQYSATFVVCPFVSEQTRCPE